MEAADTARQSDAVTLRAFLIGACIAAAAALAACGGSNSHLTASQQAVKELADLNGHLRYGTDRDNDGDHNNDDQHVLAFGRLATGAESSAITALLTRYYAAAAGSNGARACTMLAPFIAETVAEQYGRNSGLHGRSCSTVLSKLFAHQHTSLLGKQATMRIMRIGVEENRSLVAIDFPSIPEVRQITVRRIDGHWTVLDLLDGIIE